MEPKKKPDQPAWEVKQPAPQQGHSEERQDTSLPFASEGLEQVRDSHC
ncbi:hypothetical protein GGD63_001598 [Bradyrhizobium sp. cir1]|nr:hypothetical protein [Bradyrhizobium sp. cir1]